MTNRRTAGGASEGTRARSLGSSSSSLGEGGGGGSFDEEEEESIVGVGGGVRRGRGGRKKVESPATKVSGREKLGVVLRGFHVDEKIIDLIPSGWGVGAFMYMEREDLDLLSEDAAEGSMLRAAQRWIKESVSTPVETAQTQLGPSGSRGGRGNLVDPVPLPDGNVNNHIDLGRNPVLAPILGGDQARVNADPYGVGALTVAGKARVLLLYGNPRGGEATPERRLPSVVTGSSVAKGYTAIPIEMLGVILISLSREAIAQRALFWTSGIKVMKDVLWGLLGPNMWEMECQLAYKHMVEGMGIEPELRTLAQRMCPHMYGYQSAEAFMNPKVMWRFYMGRFKEGADGFLIQTFEVTPGSAKADSETGELVGRNKCVRETLDEYVRP